MCQYLKTSLFFWSLDPFLASRCQCWQKKCFWICFSGLYITKVRGIYPCFPIIMHLVTRIYKIQRVQMRLWCFIRKMNQSTKIWTWWPENLQKRSECSAGSWLNQIITRARYLVDFRNCQATWSGIGDWGWGLGLGTVIGDWGWGLGLGTVIGDWDWGLGLWTGIVDWDWGQGLGTREWENGKWEIEIESVWLWNWCNHFLAAK